MSVLDEVAAERQRQDAKWGEQNWPDGTSMDFEPWAEDSKRLCQEAAANGSVTWSDILQEEFAEAQAETRPSHLRAELLQVAAVAVAWVEAIDRRAGA